MLCANQITLVASDPPLSIPAKLNPLVVLNVKLPVTLAVPQLMFAVVALNINFGITLFSPRERSPP